METVKHSRWRYIKGCRCETCITANRNYQKDYLRLRIKAGITDGHGRVIKRKQSPTRTDESQSS